MADIFVSYASGDRQRVEPLASALEAEGYTVWWDRNIQGGAEFSDEIEKALQVSKIVVVVWSEQSLTSHWVKDEAAFARDRGMLLPIRLDDIEPPMGFRQHQTVDFSTWRGDINTPAFEMLRSALKTRFGDGVAQATLRVATNRTQKLKSNWPLRRQIIAMGLAGVAIAVFLAAIFLIRGSGNGAPERDAALTANEDVSGPSIAVLPFVSMSTSKEDEFFADGLSEELLNVLANIDSLKVAARTSSFYFKGKNEDLRTIGAALGVNHVLEGSVRRSGDRLRITAQLIKIDDGFHLWSETYDRTMDDIFEIQDDISRDVAGALKIALLGGEGVASESAPDHDPEAQRLFLIAQAKLSQRGLDNLRSARDLFQQAVTIEPNFARAHIGYANATLLLNINHSDLPRSEAILESKRAAGIAVGLDPDESDVYTAFGQIASHEADMNNDRELKEEGLENFQQALLLNPRNVLATYWYAIALESVGEMEQALAMYEHALSIDPLARVAHYRMGGLLMLLGRYDEAEDQLLDTLALFPEYLATQSALAELETARGRPDRAVYWAQRIYESDPRSFSNKALLAVKLAELGEIDAALEITATAAEDTTFTSNYLRAIHYIILSDHQALYDLRYVLAEHDDSNWQQAAPLAAMLMGDFEEAQDLFKSAVPEFYVEEVVFQRGGLDPVTAFAPAYVEQQLGNAARARKLIEAAIAAIESDGSKNVGARRHGSLTIGYALLGDKVAATTEVKAAYDSGYRGGWISFVGRPETYPLLESVRSEPGFQAIMARISADLEVGRKNWASGKTARDVEAELKARGLAI